MATKKDAGKTRELFGTDGIRGLANKYPITCEMALALGRAVTHYFQKVRTNHRPVIIIGKDTRLSCYMLEQAFSAGVCSQGGRAILTGPLPTPAVAFVIESMRADAGVMISASHNAFSDNGIKIFDGHGRKLPDEVELEIEQMVKNPSDLPCKLGGDLGSAARLDEVIGRYIVHAKMAFDSRKSLEGVRIVLDCANGAGYKVAPMIFSELGAEIIHLGTSPNGQNINGQCGAMYPQQCAEKVVHYRANLGICLDGDADRVIFIDHMGEIIDGDKVIGLISRYLYDCGELGHTNEVVGTVMSNMGLENYLHSFGVELSRTQVGDRYIIEKMQDSGSRFGGEPSGHMIFADYSTTGDGIISALKILECMSYYQKTLKELVQPITLYPHIIKNVAVKKKIPLNQVPKLMAEIKSAEDKLQNEGRVLLRYSGTEPLLRVMVEALDPLACSTLCQSLTEAVMRELS
jgi:phosphoglucosamine mutase